MYPLYERIWHWVQALCMIILIVTGFNLHFPGRLPLLEYKVAFWVHVVFGFILIGNTIFGIIGFLATGDIRQFFPRNLKEYPRKAIKQARFYALGIFRGEPHPVEKTREEKLNPLQQPAYMGLVFFLLPFQAITGLLVWGPDEFQGIRNALGGLKVLLPLHMAGAWLFLAFLVMHLYLTTTGHSLFAYTKAMITGWEDVEGGKEE